MKINKHVVFVVIAIIASSAIWLGSNDSAVTFEDRILQSYTTNPTRTDSVISVCAGKERNSLVSADAQA